MALTEEIMLILGARYVGGGAMSALIGDSRRLASSISTAESGMSRAAVASSRMDAAYTAGTISALKHSQALDVLAAKQAAVTVASAKYAAAQSSLAQQHAKVASPLTGMVAGNAAQARAIADQAAASERLSIATRAVTTNEQAQLAAHSALLRSEVSRNVAMDAATATGASADSVKILEAAELSLIRAKNGVSLADQRQIDLIFKQIAADDALVQANTLVSSRSAELTAITKAETEALALEVKMANEAAAANLRLGASKRSATSARMGAISTAGGLDSSVSGIANAEAGVAAAGTRSIMGIPLTSATVGMTAAGAAALGLAVVLKNAIQDSNEFGKALAQVGAQTGNTADAMGVIGKEALDITAKGKSYYSATQLVEGSQLPLSAGLTADVIDKILPAMMTISQMTNQQDLGMIGQVVAMGSGALFEGANTTAPQLNKLLNQVAMAEQVAPQPPGAVTASLSNLFASSKGLNIPSEQLLAMLVQTTRSGVGAADASHWIGMLLRSTAFKPAPIAATAAKQAFGLDLGPEALANRHGDYLGYLQNIANTIGVNTPGGQRIVSQITSSGTGGILGQKEMNILTQGNSLEETQKMAAAMKNVSNVSDQVAKNLDQSFTISMGKVGNQFNSQLTSLGNTITKVVNPALLAMAQAAGATSGWIGDQLGKGGTMLDDKVSTVKGAINDVMSAGSWLVGKGLQPNLLPQSIVASDGKAFTTKQAADKYQDALNKKQTIANNLSGYQMQTPDKNGNFRANTDPHIASSFSSYGPNSTMDAPTSFGIGLQYKTAQDLYMDLRSKTSIKDYNTQNNWLKSMVTAGGFSKADIQAQESKVLGITQRPAFTKGVGDTTALKDVASTIRLATKGINDPLIRAAKDNQSAANIFYNGVILHRGTMAQQDKAATTLKNASDSYANTQYRTGAFGDRGSKAAGQQWQSALQANLDAYLKSMIAGWGSQNTTLGDQLALDKAKNLPGAQTTDIKSMIAFIKGTPWQQEGYTSSASQQLAILDLQKQLTSVTQSSVPGAQLIRPSMSTINDVMPSFAGTISHLAGTADPVNEQIRLLKAQLSADQQTIVELRQQVSYLRVIANNTGITVKQTKPAPTPAPPIRPPAFIHPAQGLGG